MARSVWIISDLHVDAEAWTPPELPRVDLAVVAGDVANGLVRRSLPWLREHVVPRARWTVYVPGNHDAWDCRLPDEIERGHAVAAAAGIALLDAGQVLDADGVRVIGASLWTDYALLGVEARPATMAACEDRVAGMRDHRRIQARNRWGEPCRFRAAAAAALHTRHRAAIEAALAVPHDGLTLIVTHHAPHPRSFAGGEALTATDAAYASDLSPILEGPHAPDVWVHGHLHHSSDYTIGPTRILSNPRGHVEWCGPPRSPRRVPVPENPAFIPNLVLEI